ncbi:MAG: hypothetical protein ABH857_01530 [Elusimicrobiota bacterium]
MNTQIKKFIFTCGFLITLSFINVFAGGLTIDNGTVILDSGTYSFTGDVTIGANGALEVNKATITLQGNWSKSGTFTANEGVVAFHGAPSTSTISGNSIFNILRCYDSGKTLKFVEGSTQTIKSGGQLQLTGSAGDSNKIFLTSDNPGNRFYIYIYEIQRATYVYVKDSYIDSPAQDKVVMCQFETSSGENTIRWVFSLPSPPSWNSPVPYAVYADSVYPQGYTLNISVPVSIESGAAELPYQNAEIQFATDINFTQNITNYSYDTDPLVWSGWSGGEMGSNAISTVTISSIDDELPSYTTWYARVRLNDSLNWTDWTKVMIFEIKNPSWAAITAGSTNIKTLHFDELKTHISNLRLFRGLDAGTWHNFDADVSIGNRIRAENINDLRDNLQSVLSVVNASWSWSNDPAVAGSTMIRKTHIDEIRTKTELP